MSVYTVLSGSTRKESQSGKVARYIAGRLAEIDDEPDVTVLDLAHEQPQAWHEGYWDAENPPSEVWTRFSKQLTRSEGLVVVSPEWNGMVPPALLNLFLLATRGELAHKPAMIATVSSGMGGAYPVTELRAFGGKNTHICYIPDHVVVRQAGDVLNGPEPVSEPDAMLRERIDYAVCVLTVYTAAFKLIRSSGVVDLESFPYGM